MATQFVSGKWINTSTAFAPFEPDDATFVEDAPVITLTAPTVPGVHLTMPEDTCLITISAPTANLAIGQISDAGQNTITISAPVVDVHLTIPATTNIITVSAPTVPSLALTLPQTANVVTVTAPTATMLVGIQNKKNLLLWSEDFTNAVWTSGAGTGATVTANDTTAPDGTTTADKLIEDTSGLFHTVASYSQITGFNHDRTYVNASLHVKPNSLSYIALIMSDNFAGSTNRNYIFQGFYLSGSGQLIDAATGLGVNAYYGDVSTAGAHSASIEALANGWYRISAGGFIEKPSTGFNLEIALGKPPVGVPGSMDAEQYFDYTGDGASNLWVWGAQVETFVNKSQYIKTTSTQVTNDVLTFGGVSIAVSAPTAILDQNLLSAGQNTVTITAPTVAAVHLSASATVNTVTITAPTVTVIADAGALEAGQNTITLSAPAIPAVDLTIPQTANVITVSAPEETVLAETTLTAGQNTITLSAPAQSQLVEAALTAGQNTITLSAPEETVLAETTLTAGQNTITLSAPAVPSLALTMPQTVNTITVTAANAEIIQAGNLLAQANVITVSAPTVPSLVLTIPQTANVVTLTAPEETVLAEVSLAAGQNTVTVTAPIAVMTVHPLIEATANIITISAPTALLLSLDQIVEAAANNVTVSAPLLAGVHLSHVLSANTIAVTAPAPNITVTFDFIRAAGQAIITLSAPIVTVQPQYGGDTVYRETARLKFTQHETIKV